MNRLFLAFISAGLRMSAVVIAAGSLVSPLYAQISNTPDNAAAAPQQTTPADALGKTRPAPPSSTLRARTHEFEPSRFNLSPRGGQGLIQAISPYTLERWEIAT